MEASLLQSSKPAAIQQKTHFKAINQSAGLPYIKGQKRVVPYDHRILDDQGTTKNKAVWDCGSPLYDLRELVSVSNVIERNIMVFPSSQGNGSKRFRYQSQWDQLQHGSKSSKSKVDQQINGFLVFGSCIGVELWKKKIGKGGKSKKLSKRLKMVLSWFD